MKSTIITVLITALTVSVVGLGAKVYLDNSKSTAAQTVAITSEPAVTKSIASMPLAVAPPIPKAIPENPKIIKVIPQYITKSIPTQNCQMVNQTQMVENTNKNGTTGGVIGGTTGAVAGAVVGKQIGGSTAGTVIGGVVGLVGGAFAGNAIQKSTQPDQVAQSSQVRKCSHSTKTIKKIAGYNVEYTYQGHPGSVFMKNKPRGQYLLLSAINS